MLTAARLRELLRYDRETGVFVWRVTRTGTATAGAIAGATMTDGDGYQYRIIGVDGGRYRAQRLAWLYVTGEWPTGLIDHRNGDTLDNSFDNLREASLSQNGMNAKRSARNSSGFKGVSFRAKTGRWEVHIAAHGVKRYLGSFDTVEAAHAARHRAAVEMHGDFARHA